MLNRIEIDTERKREGIPNLRAKYGQLKILWQYSDKFDMECKVRYTANFRAKYERFITQRAK